MTAVSVLVASRGPAERLSRMLASVEGQAAEIVVVDNGSPGHEVSRCCEAFESARTITLDYNAGFSKAMNIAAQAAEGESLVLINDDCVCEPDFVSALAGQVDAASGVGMAAAVLLEAGGDRRIDSAGIEIDRTLLAYDYLNGEALERAATAPDPFGASAGAAAYDRDLFLEHGGFDERIFAYLEDVDLALRLRRDGVGCALAADAIAVHEHSATLGSGSAAKNALMGFGRGYLLRKWGVVRPQRLGPIAVRELVLLGGQGVLDRNLAGARGRVRGWRAAQPSESYPATLLELGGGDELGHTLARRLARRRRQAAG